MKKREFRSKKEYRAHVRAKVAGGFVNRADGNWAPLSALAGDGKAHLRAQNNYERMAARVS